MCWLGNKNNKKIITEDLITFKLLFVKKGVLCSYYMDFEYECNKIYSQKLEADFSSPFVIIRKGFHSYSTDCNVVVRNCYGLVAISFGDRFICITFPDVLQKCIIPKGSTVYINDIGEVVSDKIILTEKQIVMDKVTPNYITDLDSNEIFVFGSNKSGLHLGGAAEFALENFGAKMGVEEGLTGQCYALPTMEGINSFKEAVDKFEECVKEHPELKFLVTEVGCGIAGYTPEEVAPLFKKISTYPNVSLPISFWNVIIN